MADITYGFVQTPDRVPIYYARELGEGIPLVTADPMLYLHVSQQVQNNSDLSATRALASGAPWYLFDWRGKGMSGSGAITRDTLVSDLEAVVTSAGRCDLFAWGPAASIAITVATAHPSLVRRMLLLGTVPDWRESIFWSARFRALRDESPLGMASWMLGMQEGLDMAKALALAESWRAKMPVENLDRYRDAMIGDDLRDVAKNLRTPVVVVAEPFYAARSRELIGMIPGMILALLDSQRAGAAWGKTLRQTWDSLSPPLEPAVLPDQPGRALTIREREVLQLIVVGLSNAEIAERLTVSHATAARHVANIFEKLGIHNRAQAVACAYRLGYVPNSGSGA